MTDTTAEYGGKAHFELGIAKHDFQLNELHDFGFTNLRIAEEFYGFN